MSTLQNIRDFIAAAGSLVRFLNHPPMPLMPGASYYGIGLNMGGDLELQKHQFIWPLGSQYLLDPNEVNGWSIRGPFDDLMTIDLGNANSAVRTQTAGGLMFPWPVRLLQMGAFHRNSNADVEAWGFNIFKQLKTNNSTAVTTTHLIDEVADNSGVGPRDYQTTIPQMSTIPFDAAEPNNIIGENEILTLAVSAPTAVTTNYYVQMYGGYLLFERV